MIAQTKRGALNLVHEGGAYTLTTNDGTGAVLAHGKPAAVRPVLASMYVVVQ